MLPLSARLHTEQSSGSRAPWYEKTCRWSVGCYILRKERPRCSIRIAPYGLQSAVAIPSSCIGAPSGRRRLLHNSAISVSLRCLLSTPVAFSAAVLHIATREDQYYSSERTRSFESALRRLASDVSYREYEGPHAFPRRSIPFIHKWILDRC